MLYTKADKGIETITDLGPPEELFDEYMAFFNQVTEKYKAFLKPELRDVGLYTSAKRGPNGHSMMDADKDYFAIKESGILHTIRSLNSELDKFLVRGKGREVKVAEAFAPEYDNFVNPDHLLENRPRSERKDDMYGAMDSFIQWRMEQEPEAYTNVNTSKIGFIPEGGCKTRVFASGDYFTQDCLKPIHRSLYVLLSKLDTDGTSSHNRIAQLVKQKTSEGKEVWSYDLTAFTDRYPVFIQEYVLGILYSPDIAKLWRKLITDRNFYCEGSHVRYNCGQPMGLLSSWAAAAITHHVTVEACALKAGFTSFKDYCLIGDDVTIFNSKVAREYRRFLDHFSINISESKSLHSSGKPSSAEIAKRLFKDGVELSPIPPDAIESAIKDYLLFPNLMKLALERGVELEQLGTPVHSIAEHIYKRKYAERLCIILSNPLLDAPLTRVTPSPWEDYPPDIIRMAMVRSRYAYVSESVTNMYNRDMLRMPDLGILGYAMQSSRPPNSVGKHPLAVVLRNYRDRLGSIYQKVAARRVLPEDLDQLPFLVSPLIPQFLRRQRRIEKIRSTIILKAYECLSTPSG
jgi:hypothetical protein